MSLKERIELIVLFILIQLNKIGIPVRVSKRGNFALVTKVENDNVYFLFVQEMLGFLNFSGGRPDKGESDQDSVKREVKEETDLDVESECPIIIKGEEIIFQGALNLSYSIYRCRIIGGELNPNIQGGRFLSLLEIKQLRRQGKLLGNYICDAIVLWGEK